jgi:hypothetical protein
MGLGRLLAVTLAALVVLTAVLVVALALVGLCRVTEYYVRYATLRVPRARLSERYPALKTGDLLFFVAGTHALTNSMLTQTFYSHVGVVLREGALAYISETTAGCELAPYRAGPGAPPAEWHMQPGADLTPLLTRLKYYTGLCHVSHLDRPLGPRQEEALKREAERLRREAYPYPSTAQAVLGLFGVATRTRHCFQHVAQLLDVAGLTPAGRGSLADAGFLAACREVCELPGRPLPGGYRYGAPVELLYDIGPDGAEKTDLGLLR